MSTEEDNTIHDSEDVLIGHSIEDVVDTQVANNDETSAQLTPVVRSEEHDQEENEEDQKTNDQLESTHDANVTLDENIPLSETESENTFPKCSIGPYSLITLIDKIPTINQEIDGTEGAVATCIEAWELNIYIGTSKGELLHFFKLDDEFGFMLISRQRINSKTLFPVKKIVLLPEISRALLLCNSAVSCFMMPEMSPANIGKIKDVHDISLDIDAIKLDQKRSNRIVPESTDHKGIRIVLFTSKSLRFVLVTPDTMKLLKDMNYRGLQTGLRSSHLAVVAANSNYDILDLEKGKKTPLFPVTSVPQSLINPNVVPINTEEFLLSCGTRTNEPAIGMIVNKLGDVSRGTISWSQYPKHLISDYPHVIASLGKSLEVHSVQDQQLLQTIEFQEKVQISSVSHIFNRKFEEISDIIRLVPLLGDAKNYEAKIDEETQLASKYANVSSSSLIYSAEEGVKLLIPSPMLKRILRLIEGNQHLESIYDDIEDEIKAIDKSTEYGEIQFKFSRVASSLALLQHYQFNRALDYFIDNQLDPRIGIFLFAEDVSLIFGELWIYNGLVSKLEKLRLEFQKVMKLETPNDDQMVLKFAMDEFYKLLIKNYFSNKELELNSDVLHSIQVIYFLNEISASEFQNFKDIDDFVESTDISFSASEIVEQLKIRDEYVVLISFYKKLGRHEDAMKLLVKLVNLELKDDLFNMMFDKAGDAYSFIVKYAVENISDDDLIWEYGEWLLEKSPSYGVKLFSSPDLKAEVSEIKVLRMLYTKKLFDLTTNYLEVLLLSRNEIQFIGDLIYELTRKMVNLMSNDKKSCKDLSDAIIAFKNLEAPKLTFSKYLKMEFKGFANKELCQLHNQLFNYLLITTKETTTITREKNVNIVKHCENELKLFKDQLPYIMILLEFKLDEFSKCVGELCSLTDFKTAEFVATRLNIPYNLPNYNDKVDKFIDIHRSRSSSQVFGDLEDEEATLAVRSITTSAEGSKEELTEDLLLQIFENYLQLNNFRMIQSFLNTHHLFDVSIDANEGLEKLFDKFELILAKLPPSFPVALVNTFLCTTLMRIADADKNKTQLKNLNKALNKKLKLVRKDLKQS